MASLLVFVVADCANSGDTIGASCCVEAVSPLEFNTAVEHEPPHLCYFARAPCWPVLPVHRVSPPWHYRTAAFTPANVGVEPVVL